MTVWDPFVAAGLTPVGDPGPGAWITERATGEWATVGSLLPSGFAAYARVFHPAYRWTSDRAEAGEDAEETVDLDGRRAWRGELRWSEVAAANRRIPHPAMEWRGVAGEPDARGHSGELWSEEPQQGSLPLAQSRRLVAVLRHHTRVPERCWFALWDGYGDVDFPSSVPRLEMRHRPMVLLAGTIDAWLAYQQTDPWQHSPTLWWPDDRVWCVASDVDLMATYVAGSTACIDAIVTASGLEALRVEPSQPTTEDQDTINLPAA